MSTATTPVDELLRRLQFVGQRRVIAERLEQLLDEANAALIAAHKLAALERLDAPDSGARDSRARLVGELRELERDAVARQIATAALCAGELASALDGEEVQLLAQLRSADA